MSDTKEEKKIPLKNYFILLMLFSLCIGLVLYFCRMYQVYDEEQKKVPVIQGRLSEIYQEDLDHLILENPTMVIYMCTSNDSVCRDFEKSFIKLLKKNDYSNEIIYLNLTGQDVDSFIDSFNERYSYKTKLTNNYPSFVLFEDGEVQGILQGNEKKSITISKVRQFLELNHIGEE